MAYQRYPNLWASFDGAIWPIPGEGMDNVERELRYNPGGYNAAASVVSAYRHLISLPSRRREEIVRKLRKEMKRNAKSA